jgi:hypothetical protein
MINRPPSFLTGTDECEIITITPYTEFGFLSHAGVFHKQKLIHLQFAEDLTLLYGRIQVNHLSRVK